MTFEFSHVALLGISYLLLLFGIAYVTDRGWLPDSITKHPVTYILSMGIFASAWAYYGVVDLANQFGYGALAYYLGTGAFFLFSPVIQAPLAELARRYQLVSIADLLSFRYHSPAAGGLATLCMLLAVLPLMILQIQAVADTLNLMSFNREVMDAALFGNLNQRDTLAFFYCVLVTLFCLVFGANPKRHSSMITAMAFESLVKVGALLAIGWFAVYQVFGGFEALNVWLQDNPEQLRQLQTPLENSVSHTLLLVFIATGVLMPHIFQMSHTAMPIRTLTHTVTWAFPLFLLLMAIPIFPILWAGMKLEVTNTTIEYFTLGVPLSANSEWFSLVAFIGGLSAASGALIISLLSIATMVLNHWLLPLLPFKAEKNLYSQLRWLRRLLILIIAIIGYSFYRLLPSSFSLMDLALLAFIEALQFLPGVIAVSQWPQANRKGLIAGLIIGTIVWMIGLAAPVLLDQPFSLSFWGMTIPTGMEHWHSLAIIALGCNSATFIVVSLLTQQSEQERLNAEICADDALSSPVRHALEAQTIDDFYQQLAPSLGKTVAEKEIDRAMQELKFNRNERRPFALRRLRNRLEINLAGLLGQAKARHIIETRLPYKPGSQSGTDINLIETRLERASYQLTGIAADINRLRLYHRDTLQTLPLAICSLGSDGEVLMWNHAMARLTGTTNEDILGAELHRLPAPWQSLIGDFVDDQLTQTSKKSIEVNGKVFWYRLHKSIIQEANKNADGQVILIEDITETERLEQELIHQGRLASIGRLAAGVAHEIGNPVTGIACLAQNLPYEDEDERQMTAQQILTQTERISRIVSSLVSFAHSGEQTQIREPVTLSHCVDEAIALLSLQKDKDFVSYRNELTENDVVSGDWQRLIQVFVNLLSNARDATPASGGEVVITSERKTYALLVSVIDQGSGIAPEHINAIMEPFFTTKEAGQGTGLGLAMVYSIIEEHGGHITVKSPVHDGKGTCFTLAFKVN